MGATHVSTHMQQYANTYIVVYIVVLAQHNSSCVAFMSQLERTHMQQYANTYIIVYGHTYSAAYIQTHSGTRTHMQQYANTYNSMSTTVVAQRSCLSLRGHICSSMRTHIQQYEHNSSCVAFMSQLKRTHVAVCEHIYSSMSTTVVAQRSCLSLSCNKKKKTELVSGLQMRVRSTRQLLKFQGRFRYYMQMCTICECICKCPYVIQVDSGSISKASSARCFTDALLMRY